MKLIKKAVTVGAEGFVTFTIVGRSGYHRWFSVPSGLIAKEYPAGRRHVAQQLRDARQEVRSAMR